MANPDRVQLDGVSKQAADRLAAAFVKALHGSPLLVQLAPPPDAAQPEVPVPEAGAYVPLLRTRHYDAGPVAQESAYLDPDGRLRWVDVDQGAPPAAWTPLYVLALPR